MVAEMGPFHIALNFCEQILEYYHFVFADMYYHAFCKRLAKSPKCWKIEYCICIIMFLGWLTVRQEILQFFSESKDHEVTLLFYLLKELVPMAFFYYTTVSRGGNYDLFGNMMEKLAIVMICFRRRHYDKARLSWISDREHFMRCFPEYISCENSHLAVFTEKNC